jgi:hypothetical protein
MTERDYERIGKFIYGACRYGADETDIRNWMADDLGIALINPDDDRIGTPLYSAFAAKYSSDAGLQANLECFLEFLKKRPA